MTVTISQDSLTENGTLDYATNVVNGRNVAFDGVREHINDGHYRQGVLWVLLQESDTQLDCKMENIEVCVDLSRQYTPFLFWSNEDQ